MRASGLMNVFTPTMAEINSCNEVDCAWAEIAESDSAAVSRIVRTKFLQRKIIAALRRLPTISRSAFRAQG